MIKLVGDEAELKWRRFPYAEGVSLESDGNSRWVRDEETDEWCFVVNRNYRPPKGLVAPPRVA